MTILIFILIIITCLVLSFFVLIQNPKGGGLAGSFGGLGNQMMGAKQSTDVVEKGTWWATAVLLGLILLSFILAPKENTNINQKTRAEKAGAGSVQAPALAPQTPAANTITPQGTPTPETQGTPIPMPATSGAPTTGK